MLYLKFRSYVGPNTGHKEKCLINKPLSSEYHLVLLQVSIAIGILPSRGEFLCSTLFGTLKFVVVATTRQIYVLGPNYILKDNRMGKMLLKSRWLRFTTETIYLGWGVGIINFLIVAKISRYVVANPTQQ